MLASAGALRAQDTTQTARDSASPPPPASDATATDSASGQTHTVRKGDTLWDLAHQYLNDPFLWPEIYRLNTQIVEDPHWIYPGEVLKVPGGAQLVAEDSMAPQLLRPVDRLTRVSSAGPTVFSQQLARNRMVSRVGSMASTYPHTAVRAGEFYAAPWVDRVGGPGGAGEVVANVDVPGIAQVSERDRLFPQDRIYITLPAGIVAARGDRFVIVGAGPELDGGTQVMIPTGIVEIERPGNGDASTARIVQQFGDMRLQQAVLPLDRFNMPVDARPVPLAAGPESKVVAVPSNAVLPTVGYYVILDATAKDGVKLGDLFTLYRARNSVDVPGHDKRVTLPEEPIAMAQAVKVTDRGTTVIVLDQRQPAIKVGVQARLTARMP